MLITEADISATALTMCRRHNHWVHQVIQTDIMDLPFPDGSFDGAYNLGVMEHFTEAEIRKVLLQLHRVIKPHGKMVIFWPHARATSVLVLNLVHWVLNRILRQNVRLHPAEISLFHSRDEIEPLLREIGFDIVDYYFGPRDMFVQAVLVMEKR
jgi:ubiquinone/menaquinone biosynthesis C-methylase UbiE